MLENVEFGIKNLENSGVTVAGIIQKAKLISKKFNQSPLLSNALRKELSKQNKSYESLITAVVTRWNSLFFMLERLLDAWDAVSLVLTRKKHHDLLLSEEELAVIPDVLILLDHFSVITNVMSQENVVTISSIVPYVTGLLKELEKLSGLSEKLPEIPLKTVVGKNFSKCLYSQAKRRLLSYEESSIAR